MYEIRRHAFTKLVDNYPNQEELADKLGLSPGYISHLKTGYRPITEKSARKFEKKLSLCAGFFDESDRIDCEVMRQEISNVEPGPRIGTYSKIPVIGSAQLGDNGHWSELEYPVGHGDGYILYPTKDLNAYALRCVGDSMKPRIRDGEFVIVEPNAEPIPGDEILLKTVDGRVMVKTFLYRRDGRVHVMSINEAHQPQSFDLAEIDKIHPVAAIVKKALWEAG